MMSKMSQLHAELSEQASELGFESLGEAEQAGYGVVWNTGKLIAPQELAHEAWLKEREEIIESLDHLMLGYVEMGYDKQAGVLQRAIEFIRKGEC